MITIPPQIGIQFDELRAEFSALELFGKPNGPWRIIGPIGFIGNYNNEPLEVALPIAISVPKEFPGTLPTVKEHQSNILDLYPHVNPIEKTFCLGTEISLSMAFARTPTLSFFVREFLVPFLYSAFVWMRTGRIPFPDSPHGPLGILLDYCRIFQVHDPEVVMGFLEILATRKLHYPRNCPCGSRKDFQSCHAEAVRSVGRYQRPEAFLSDWAAIVALRKLVAEQRVGRS